MVNTRAETYANAKRFSDENRYKPEGMCLQWCREMADIPAKYDDAIGSANHAPRKMGTPPVGTFVYWKNLGSGEHGHIAISAGNDNVYSTDIVETSRVDRVSISYISNKWNMQYIGWSDECNDVTLASEKDELDMATPADVWNIDIDPSSDETAGTKLRYARQDARNIWAEVKGLNGRLGSFEAGVDGAFVIVRNEAKANQSQIRADVAAVKNAVEAIPAQDNSAVLAAVAALSAQVAELSAKVNTLPKGE